MVTRALVLAVVVAVLSACPGPTPGPDGGTDGGVLTDACATQHAGSLGGAAITVCDALYPSAPFVHLPADSADAVYGGVDRDGAGGAVFRTRTTTFAISATLPAWLEQESSFGALRYAYVLYRAQLSGGTVSAVTPVVQLDDRVFQRLLGGLQLEGSVSMRDPDAGDSNFVLTPLELPLRLRLDAMPQTTATDSSTGFERFAINGVIENAHARVRASDGGCLVALDGFGARNPFFTADGGTTVVVLRHPGMHVALDDVFTLDWPEGTTTANNMGGGLVVLPGALLRPALPVFTEAANHPHGVPWGGPGADLAVVTSGGQACP